ncbi:caspase family protein [Bradyrhizobium diazoefficiens]|nr:caspase family protein [Bradyrhizobium diazoefficiens]
MRRASLFMVGLLLIFSSSVASAETRVALVIGNAKYLKAPRLMNPANDAADVEGSLKRLGFSVSTALDANYDAMRRAVGDFTRRARAADYAILFYSGHGMEVGGENWLIPIDAELQSDTDAETQAINMKTAMLAVSSSRALGLVILDACRNNPFLVRMERTNRTRAVEPGFVRVEPGDNVMVIYAAKDGTTALDGSGRNSPFSDALVRHIETPGLEITQLFRVVRDEVMQSTARKQQPFVYGTLSKQLVYLKPPATAPLQDEQRWQIITQAAASQEFNEAAPARIKHGLELKAVEQFVREYPDSKLIPVALQRVRALKELIASDPPTPDTTQDEAAWQNIQEVRSGKLFPEWTPPQRLQAEQQGLEAFRKKYPNSRHEKEAAVRMAELSSAIEKNPLPDVGEELAWRTLNQIEAGTLFKNMRDQQRLVFEASSLEEFIKRWPNSLHLAEAQRRLEVLEQKLAGQLDATIENRANSEQGADAVFIATIKVRPASSLLPTERKRLAKLADRRPSLELEIPFEYNSAAISAKALPVLRALGRVLSSEKLQRASLLIGGHADASGATAYNQELSQRRAEAVKRFLLEENKLSPANLIACGFGQDYPRNRKNPRADENRRVQIVNLSGT